MVHTEPDGKPGIEYVDKSWNAYTGCLNGFAGNCRLGRDCWAFKRSLMLEQNENVKHRERYHNFQPATWPERLDEPLKRKKPTRYAVAFMGDISYCPDDFMEKILQVCQQTPRHRYYFLTKRPARIQHWSFPNNCWVGTTVNDKDDLHRVDELRGCIVMWRWLSIEPLYGPLEGLKLGGIRWVAVGAKTGSHPMQPEGEWVDDILGVVSESVAYMMTKPNLDWPYRLMSYPDDDWWNNYGKEVFGDGK